MRRLEEIASLLPTVDSVPGLVSTVDAIVDQVVDIEHSGIYLYDTERGALVLHSAKGFTEEERRLAEESAMTRHPGQVFRTREVLLTQDVETNPQGTSSSPRSFQIRSRVYLPVMCRNHCVGVFGLASQRVNAFSDEHISFLSFLCNITGVVYSQLQAAAKHRALEEQLFHSQKMEALGRLAGGISHDFNNFLTVISGYTGLLAETLEDPEALGDLQTIQQATSAAANLSRQLLAFSRREAVVPRVFDARLELVRIRGLLQPLLGGAITLKLVSPDTATMIEVDEGEFELTLMNLATNARDAMPEGGTLTITLSERSLPNSTDGHSPAGDFVCIRVEDTGVGMDKATQTQIFEPFYTTKARGRGTGLGLATVGAIIRRYQGRIEVESSPEKGTAFTLALPRSESAQRAPIAPPIHPRRSSGSETVLVVEDESLIRSLVLRALKGAGYHVLEAENGEEGMEQLAAHHKDIDLIITDMLMPRMNGLELLRGVRKDFPELPVLIITGYTSDLRMGSNLTEFRSILLRKPFTPSLLLQRVRAALDGAHTHRQLDTLCQRSGLPELPAR